MKKSALVLALALVAASFTFAQVAPGSSGTVLAQAQTVTVEGKLALINGMIGVKSGSKTYYLCNIARLTGFVEGVKEGASVKAEGYEYPIAAAPEYSTVRVTKLTVGGKEYDLGQAAGRGMGGGQGCQGWQGGQANQNGFGGMRGGRRS